MSARSRLTSFVNHFAAPIQVQANIEMEPTRLTVRAILSPQRAAHFARLGCTEAPHMTWERQMVFALLAVIVAALLGPLAINASFPLMAAQGTETIVFRVDQPNVNQPESAP